MTKLTKEQEFLVNQLREATGGKDIVIKVDKPNKLANTIITQAKKEGG